MRIVCPACDAAYEVPDAMLADGLRMVRCARCSHQWLPGGVATAPAAAPSLAPPAPEPEPAEEEDDAAPAPLLRQELPPTVPDLDPMGRQEPRLTPARTRPEPPPAEPPPDLPPPGGAVAIAAWAFSLLLLVGLAAAAVAWRTQVMAAWPPSERVYAALGLS